MPSPAMGSAHHHPKTAFKVSPPSRIAERYAQRLVWRESACRALLFNSAATRRLARASKGITTREATATRMPNLLRDGTSWLRRLETLSQATKAASAKKLTPTIRSDIRSTRSRLPLSESERSRHISTVPAPISIIESSPNPISATLPAMSPETIAATASRKFQAIVRDSR